MKKRMWNWIVKTKEILIITGLISGFMCGAWTFAWGYFVAPKVDSRIEEKLAPAQSEIKDIKELVAYMTFIMEATADPDKITIAEKQYSAWKKRVERLDK